MAYQSTYSSLLSDQEDLINQYMQMEQEIDRTPIYDVDEVEVTEEEQEENIPDDYEMYKKYYEENEARTSLDDDESDLEFLNFIFEGNNKYQSFSTPREQSMFPNYAGNVSSSFKDSISQRESGGNYKAISPNSSARGKYQFIWSIHKDQIAQQTGVRSQQEFLNNPEAQEAYFDYWDRTVLTPSANANLAGFQKYYPNATADDVKRATHFAGRGGLEKAIRTGNFTQGIDANKTSIQKYVFKN